MGTGGEYERESGGGDLSGHAREPLMAEKKTTNCLLTVRVQPRASRTEIVSLMPDGSVKVKLKAQPERDQANRELVSLISGSLGVPLSSVSIVKGRASRLKVVLVAGMNDEEARARVAEALARKAPARRP
ncbi:MAG: DUF167 domain-containing protein [Candidatus Eisenbacteria bacterium]